MKRQTFVLLLTKDYRRFIRVFLKNKEGKPEQRNVTFTTEHKVSEKERNRNAKRIQAEFSTSDERLYDGLLRSTAYGKTFVLKGDPEGKLKREPIDLTPFDAKRIALKNHFDAIGLEFDSTKPIEVLEEEYQIYVNAKTGSNIKGSGPAEITHKPINVEKQITEAVDSAKALYKEKYGEDIPDEFANDKAFLSALPDPNFDAKAYIDKAYESVSEDTTETIEEESLEDLHKQYFDKFGKNVANLKKNDKAWIKDRLAE